MAIIKDNIFVENTYHSALLSGSSNNTVIDNTFIATESALVTEANNTLVFNNTFVNTTTGGLDVCLCTNITIASNRFINTTWYGLRLAGNSNSTIKDNYFYNNSMSFPSYQDAGGINYYGPNYYCRFINNFFNLSGFVDAAIIYGPPLHIAMPTCIFENNTVNRYPLGVFSNLNNFVIDEHYGQILLYNCSYVIITNQDISFTYDGIFIGVFATRISIVNCSFSYNIGSAIRLDSPYILIMNNTFFSNNIGICTMYEGYISYNTFLNNTNCAIYVGSSPNYCHHNNFLYNGLYTRLQIRIYSYGGGYSASILLYDPNTSEGNYWSDWDGEGSYNIPHATDPFPFSNPVGPYRGDFPFYTPPSTHSFPTALVTTLVILFLVLPGLTFVYLRFVRPKIRF